MENNMKQISVDLKTYEKLVEMADFSLITIDQMLDAVLEKGIKVIEGTR